MAGKLQQDIPPELDRWLKLRAAHQNTSKKALVTQAIIEFKERKEKLESKEKKDYE